MATTDKYDRQLRLWGSDGQRSLMTSKICLLNAGPTGTESLKNLVLPGCGFFHIVDGAAVTERDCANNFFVDKAHLGQPRARVALTLLLELNPDVTGECTVEDPSALIQRDLSFFDQFSIVIATQMTKNALAPLAAHLYSRNIPLIVRVRRVKMGLGLLELQ